MDLLMFLFITFILIYSISLFWMAISPGVPHMGYTYHYFKLRKAFSKFYRRHSALLEKYSVSLKTLLQQGISESEFYGDLVYRFRIIVGKSNFSEQFKKTY